MKVTVLGSGSAFSSPSRYNSSYLVETTGGNILIDCGSDALRAIQKSSTNLFSIKAIFLTHMHADHCSGLPAVLTAMHVSNRTDPIEVYLPYSQVEFSATWLANMFIYKERLTFEMSVRPIYPGRISLGNSTTAEFIESSHLAKYQEYSSRLGIIPVSYSVMVCDGKSRFFFSGDVEHLDDIKRYLPGSLSFVEATHPPLAEIAAIAREHPKDLFFTHIPQELEEGAVWKVDLEKRFGLHDLNVVHDGQVLVV